jgi:uncharacterized protein
MRIGITGVTGFIGSAVTQLAVSHGHEVIGYSRRVDRVLPGVKELRPLSLEKAQPLDASGLDVLINLAAEPILGLWTPKKRQLIRETRVDLTDRILRCIADTPKRPAAFINASGIGFYGDRGSEVLDETCGPGQDYLARLCVDWEASTQRASQLGVRPIPLRTGLVLGLGGGAFPLMRRAFVMGGGGRLGSGEQYMPWIHLTDEARMILWAAEHPSLEGPLNVCSPNPVTNREFTRLLAKAVRRPALFPVPAFALKLLMGRDLGSGLLASQRATPHRSSDAGFSFDYPELAGALQQLTT